MNGLKALLSLVLFFIAFFMGGMVISIILASFRPPLGVILIVAGLPLVVIPIAIGWLTPSLWWIGFSGAVIPLYFGITELLYMPPLTLEGLLARLPLYLPLPVSLSFAFLGKYLRRRRLSRPAPGEQV